ncbi:Protein of uncharacterised function (DUF732) [Mycolicibacterium fortuitum]|uniref:Protein of uncharacterized function (DUF732) n=1 Tax=Mycolicibacterium fortuitum TaxID=1766 RepID=A0A378WDG9_MYCFO|nr:Protein of uncharacterised function (DUF732) [Mycolicibacterium fortuitum]
MTTATRFARIIGAAALAGAAVVGAAAGPAAAWPIPLTSDEINYLNATRGAFPGDDDQRLLAGRQMCRGLYTGQSAQAVIDAAAAQYGASPDQAAAALRAARGTLCTQAPG